MREEKRKEEERRGDKGKVLFVLLVLWLLLLLCSFFRFCTVAMSCDDACGANLLWLARRINRECPESGPGQPGPVASHFNSRAALGRPDHAPIDLSHSQRTGSTDETKLKQS